MTDDQKDLGVHGTFNRKILKFKISMIATFAITAALVVSCMPELKEEEPTVGAEVAEDAVFDALDGAIANHTPANLPIGSAVHYENNYRFESGASTKLAETVTQLINRNETASNIRLTMKESFVDYSEDEPTLTEKEGTVDIAKSSVTSASVSGEHQSLYQSLKAMKLDSMKKSFSTLDAQTPVRISYHELKVNQTKAESPHCGSLPDCELNVTEVTFAVIQWYEDGSFDKQTFAFRISKDLPRLHQIYNGGNPWYSSAVSACNSSKVEINQKHYILTQCLVLRDFQ